MKICKRKILLLVAVLIMMPAMVYARTFPDTKGHWAVDPIDRLSNMHIVGGYDDGNFYPNDTISKSEFCAMLNRAAGLKRTYTVTFSDVSPGKWYYREVSKAIKAGYLVPTTGKLRPNDAISREEAARILAYMYDMQGDERVLRRFTDGRSISKHARKGVSALVEKNILTGYKDGRFAPASPVTRAEASKIFSFLIARYNLPPEKMVLDSKIHFGPKDLYQ